MINSSLNLENLVIERMLVLILYEAEKMLCHLRDKNNDTQ